MMAEPESVSVSELGFENRKNEIQACVEWAYETLFPGVLVPSVRGFGSRSQNMFTDQSDWDFAVAVSEEQFPQADDIRKLIQQKLLDRNLNLVKNFHRTQDQPDKSTLVWQRTGDNVTTSLLVSTQDSMAMAVATTEFLRDF